MSRSAVLAGRTTADLFRNLFVVILMTIVGYLVGFRFQAGVIYAMLGVALAVRRVRVLMDLGDHRPGHQESVQAASFNWIFPLTFASGAFVAVARMPGWLQAWARHNPVTIWNTIRAYTFGSRSATAMGETVLSLTMKSAIWIALILAVFVPLSIRVYRRS